MKLLIVVSCLVFAVAAKPLFGTEQCAGGPGVWCVNIRTASQCSAVKHCQQNVWNKPVVKSVPCDLCKEVMTIVENFLKDNETQSEILPYLNKACEVILPDPSLASECKELVGKYYTILLNIIEEELANPSVVCSSLHLCTSLQQHLATIKQTQLLSNEIPEMAYPFMANLPLLLVPQDKPREEPKENVDVCKDCLQLFNDIQELLKSNSSFSRMLIENALKQCDQLGGGLSEACKTYVNQYADLVLQMVVQVPSQQICSAAGLCAQGKSTPMLELTPAKVIVPAAKLQPAVQVTEKTENMLICKVCQVVMTQLESLLENNSSKEHIKDTLENICKIVPSKYCQKCTDIIDTYYNAIIELLEQEITPKQVCKILGLCPYRQPKIVKLTSEHIQSGGACQVCRMIVKYMDRILMENVTQENIKKALQVVCNYLPNTMSDECCAIVNEYEPLFIQLLMQALDSSFVCEKLKLCSNAEKPLLGSEKCMWGPSYWCKDMETAGKCNAIEHCKRHVWN